MITDQSSLQEEMRCFDLEVVASSALATLVTFRVQPILLEKIKENQTSDEKPGRCSLILRAGACRILVWTLSLEVSGSVVCTSQIENSTKILKETHRSPYTIHSGSTKMFKDLKTKFWWPGMKGYVGHFVTQCLVCQQVKVEHQLPVGKL